MAFRCSLCPAALPSARAHALHRLHAHGDVAPDGDLPGAITRLRAAAKDFRKLPDDALKLLRYFVEQGPNPHAFDELVFQNAGISLAPGMPGSSSTVRRWLKAKMATAPLRTGWFLPYRNPQTGAEASVHVPCIDFEAAVRLLFLNRFVGWVIASEGARCATFPRAWNWVPNARRSALVEQHPVLGHQFGMRGAGGLRNRGRNGPWLLYFDGAKAFEKSSNATVSLPGDPCS